MRELFNSETSLQSFSTLMHVSVVCAVAPAAPAAAAPAAAPAAAVDAVTLYNQQYQNFQCVAAWFDLDVPLQCI